MVLATRCNSPLRVTEYFVVTRCFANRSQISGSRSSPNLDRYLLSSRSILRTAIKGVSAPARSLTRAFIVWHSDPWTLPPEHCSLTCESQPNMLKQTKKRIVCAAEYMQSTMLLWHSEPMMIRPVFSYLRGGCYLTISASWSYFATQNSSGLPSFPGLLQKEIKAGSTKGQAAPLEEEKATRHTCKHVYLFIAGARCASSWRRAGHPNRNVFQLARKGPDQMLRRCSFWHRLSKRVYVCNTLMSLSTLVGRAIKPHDTGEPSSLSQASDHYIDSPTGSASPLQKREL